MFELLLALIVGYGVWRVLASGRLGPASAAEQDGAAASSAPAAAAPGARLRKVLKVDGTEAVEGSIAFVKGYGVDPSEVLDVRRYVAEHDEQDPPGRVLDCLQRSHGDGFTRGVEAAQVAERVRRLRRGETVYFILVRKPYRPMEDIVAFVKPAA